MDFAPAKFIKKQKTAKELSDDAVDKVKMFSMYQHRGGTFFINNFAISRSILLRFAEMDYHHPYVGHGYIYQLLDRNGSAPMISDRCSGSLDSVH